MKIEEGKVLTDLKIDELEKLVKIEIKENKIDYFNTQVLPKLVSVLIPAFGEYFIIHSDLNNEYKNMFQVPILFYCLMLFLINYLSHQEYSFSSSNQVKLERIKRIKNYLDSNINILKDVDVKDFEWFINNIDDDLQLCRRRRKTKKL